jgi:hypothetical protein
VRSTRPSDNRSTRSRSDISADNGSVSRATHPPPPRLTRLAPLQTKSGTRGLLDWFDHHQDRSTLESSTMASSYKDLPLGFLTPPSFPLTNRTMMSIASPLRHCLHHLHRCSRYASRHPPTRFYNPSSGSDSTTIGNSTTDVDDDDFNAAFLNEFDQKESWRFRERSQMTDEEHAAFLERAKNAPSESW